MAIDANEVTTYETRYNCVIGCGSSVSSHEMEGNYVEQIGAILESVPPMWFVGILRTSSVPQRQAAMNCGHC